MNMATPVPDAAKSKEIREKMRQRYDYEVKTWSDVDVLDPEEVEHYLLPETEQALAEVHPDVTER